MKKNVWYLVGGLLAFTILLVPMVAYRNLFSSCSDRSISHKVMVDLSALDGLEHVAPVVVVGSGPGGLMAALYTARAGHKTYVLEGNKPGGQLMETTYVENFPSHAKILGSELMDLMRKQAALYGVVFLRESLKSVDYSAWPYVVKTEEGTLLHTMALVITTGSAPRKLGVSGEQEYWGGKGVTSCATCDAPFYKGKKVVVVGGGDSAFEEAQQVAAFADQVTIIVRRGEKDVRASLPLRNSVKNNSKISIAYHKEIKKIVGDGSRVTHIELYDNEKDSTQMMPIDGVFLAIGHVPNTKVFGDELALTADGVIKLDGRTQHTNLTGVFAAGDVADSRYRQAGSAAGDGIKAGIDVSMFLQSIGFSSDVAAAYAKNFFVPVVLKKISVGHLETIADFNSQVLKSDVPVILDFYTSSCSSCKYMMPFFEAAAGKYSSQMKFFKVDAQASKELADFLVVVKVPTFLVYKGGQLVARYQSVMTQPKMFDFIEQFITKE
jgi:thioredoxin reductase (NADPH)